MSEPASYGTSLDAQLERLIEQSFVRRVPRVPMMLPRFNSTSLPDVVKYVGCLIFCPDTTQVRASNGAAWVVL